MRIKGEGRSGTSRDSNPACLCCSSAHLVQCEPDEASSFTNPNVGPGTYASLRLKQDAWSSAVQGGQRRQKCSSPPEGSLVETKCLIKGPKSAICSFSRATLRTEVQSAVFILRPTNVRIWHKAVFKVGPVAGPEPNAIGSSKNASDPVGIPLCGAPQAAGDKPNPSEEG